MVKRLKEFVLPSTFKWEKLTNTYGKCILEPLERGYGTTIGNALRRVLLSSIPGAAITEARIEGVLHEFSTVEGVREDIPEILHNLKHVIIKLYSDGPEKVYLDVSEEGEVRADDIQGSPHVEILNPHLHIATLNPGAKLRIDMEVRWGKGYVPAERNKRADAPLGTIPLDSIFTPVRKVNFEVENTRVGDITDYERLILEVWTNGSVTPDEAIKFASELLIDHFSFLQKLGEGQEKEEDISPKESTSKKDKELEEILSRKLSEFDLSMRCANCLKSNNIQTIGDLIKVEEKELLQHKNFGKKSLQELKDLLSSFGLSFKSRKGKESSEGEKIHASSEKGKKIGEKGSASQGGSQELILKSS